MAHPIYVVAVIVKIKEEENIQCRRCAIKKKVRVRVDVNLLGAQVLHCNVRHDLYFIIMRVALYAYLCLRFIIHNDSCTVYIGVLKFKYNIII